MLHLVSRRLQPGIRYIGRHTPDLQQLALQLACLKGEGTGLPRSTRLTTTSNLGGFTTPKILQFREGSYKTFNLIICTDTRRYT